MSQSWPTLLALKACLAFFLVSFPLYAPNTADDFSAEELEDFDDDVFLLKKKDPLEKVVAKENKTEGQEGLIGWSLFGSNEEEDRYIINFNNVSILEYIRFVSKISNINFQFEQADLNFPISIISEQPLTIQEILSTLIQTLRAHGFNLLEQGKNTLFITKSAQINQIPSIITKEQGKKEKAPIVTRIFRIQYANLSAIGSLIRPMMSQGASLEALVETRQLIVTDIATNVEQIATLLNIIDKPNSPLDIETYKARHLPAEAVITLAKQIVGPFAEGNPLLFVAQNETNTIFIVSTPFIIEKAIEVMEDLDVPPNTASAAIQSKEQVYLYKVQTKGAEELLEALEKIAHELQGSGSQSIKLINALKKASWVKESNSLLFVTDPETQVKIEELLKTLETVSSARNFYIYKIAAAGREQIQGSLNQLAKSLQSSHANLEIIDAIQSMRYIKESNSLIFTGSDEALQKLQDLLPLFDTAVAAYSPSSHYWLYSPQFLSGSELEDSISELEKSLKTSGLTDPSLLSAIESMQWVPTTNTLLFTGTPVALEHIQSIIKLIDIPSGAPTKIFLYQPKFISYDQIERALDELADKLDRKNLSDKNLATAIDSMTWIGDSQTFLFKSDPSSIEKIQTFLTQIDSAKEAAAIANSYFLYKLKYAAGEDILAHLEKVSKGLSDKDPAKKTLLSVITDMTYLKDANALLLTGPQKAVDDIKELINQFDVAGTTPASYEKTAFFIYKPHFVDAEELQSALKQTSEDLKNSGLVDASLLQSIDTMRYVLLTNSLVFTGTKESLAKTAEIIATIDLENTKIKKGFTELEGHTFLIYKARYISITEILSLLTKVTSGLEKEDSTQNKALVEAIKTAKEIQETNSILFTGPSPVLEKIDSLLKQLDVPKGIGDTPLPRAPGSYIIYKPQHVSGPGLIEMMKDFERNLLESGFSENALFETIDNLKYIDKTDYILISGEQKSIEKVQELLRKFDVSSVGAVTSLVEMETSFLVYKLQYHPGTEIQQALKQIGQDLTTSDPNFNRQLLTAINSIQWIKITNSLLATGTPEVLTQLKELIQNVDVPLRQVFIEVLIIQTTLSNNQQFGLQWGSKIQYLNRFAGGTSNFPGASTISGASPNQLLGVPLAAVNATRTPLATDIPNPSAQGGSLSGGFDLGVIGDIILHKGQSFLSLASLVNALQQDDDSVIVMNPKIVAQDNQLSSIFVGQNIPFAGSSVTTTQQAGSQQATNIEYRDVGVNLSITPFLGAGDIVTLQISNDITSQVDNTTNAVNGIEGLQTSRTSLNARVHVPNKQFVALSGMIQDTRSHFKSGIPCLGGLPIIGALFSESDRFDSRNNLIFFIRPVIIDSIEEYQKITENQEKQYKETSIKQIVKEEIDQAIDSVRGQEE